MKREKLSKSVLTNLLNEEGSVGKVATVTGIPYSTIYSWYKSYDIDLPKSCMTVYEELRSVNLTSIHKSVILGSILGDGCLIKQKSSKNARLQIGHCSKQLPYLRWKKNLLNPFCKSPPVLAEKSGRKVICGKESYTTGYYILNTIAHPGITEYYNKYYFGGKKRVHTDVIEDLDELSLAVWLADDGSFSLRSDCKYSLKGNIATCSFYDDEIELLMIALSKFYTGNMSINKNRTIGLSGTVGIDKLIDTITGILPTNIHYKLVPQRLIRKAPI